jgi:hypothetical protein
LIYIDQEDDNNFRNKIKQYDEDQRQNSERLNQEVEEIISKEIEMTLKTFRRPHSAVPSADNLVKMTPSFKSKRCTPVKTNENSDENLHIKEDVWFYFH